MCLGFVYGRGATTIAYIKSKSGPPVKRHMGRVVPAGGKVEFFYKNDKAAALYGLFVASCAVTTLTTRTCPR